MRVVRSNVPHAMYLPSSNECCSEAEGAAPTRRARTPPRGRLRVLLDRDGPTAGPTAAGRTRALSPSEAPARRAVRLGARDAEHGVGRKPEEVPRRWAGA